MDKDNIISAISIEFGLSKEQSEIIVSNIFVSIAQSLRKNRNLEIQKFGKFKLILDKDSKTYIIKFTPSKKLSIRANNNFEGLKKVKLRQNFFKINEDVSDYKIPETERERESEILPTVIPEAIKEDKEIIINPSPRKLISDDLIKLHKEITMEEESEPSKTNLWG